MHQTNEMTQIFPKLLFLPKRPEISPKPLTENLGLAGASLNVCRKVKPEWWRNEVPASVTHLVAHAGKLEGVLLGLKM